MHVAIAIVGFRNAYDIVRCLGALADTTHRDFEVVICENGGPEAYEDLEGQLPGNLTGGQTVRYLLAPGNLGYAGGVNVCMGNAPDADGWWVLNPDTCPEPGALAAMVARLSVGDCEAVGSTLHLPGGEVQSHGGRWRAWLARSVSIGHGTAWGSPVDRAKIEGAQNYLNGASMLISRRFREVTGPMREDYFLYCEEVEWCLRGKLKGLRLGYAENGVVMHFQGTTTGNPPDIRQRSRGPVFLNERNKLLLTRDLFPYRLPVAALAALVVIFLRFGRRGAWKQLGYALSGWCDGLRGKRGRPVWMS